MSAQSVLAGLRIVVTRARAQAAELGERLEALGAQVIYCPAIRIAAPDDQAPLRRAAAQLETFDWVVLTSANGVTALYEELERQDGAARLERVKVACVGPGTAQALQSHGVRVLTMPAEFVGAEIAHAIAAHIRSGERRVLLARGRGGNPDLPERLRALGAEVTEVESYRSIPDLENLNTVKMQLAAGAIDVITFTSPSTATYFVEGVGTLPENVALAAIGPVTAARMRELNLEPSVVAQDHTVPGLVQALAEFVAGRSDRRGRF